MKQSKSKTKEITKPVTAKFLHNRASSQKNSQMHANGSHIRSGFALKMHIIQAFHLELLTLNLKK